MSYNQKYFFSFYADRDTRIEDGVPDEYLCEILQLNYEGSAIEIQAQQNPIQINYQNTSDYKFEPFVGSECTLNLIATEDFQLEDLYTENEREFLVKVYRNNEVIWRGFIIPDGCQEAFTFSPYPISVNAVDGLGLLKNLSFAQNDGNFYLGKKTWIEIIYACLDRLEIPEMDLYTCVNIYEITMTQGNSYDPMALSYVNAERYIKDDAFNPMNCQEVLDAVLRVWTARIIQSDGHWYIYRPNESALNGTLAFRKYIDGVYDSVVSKDMERLLGGESEGLIDAPYFHINTDQMKMIEKPFKTASISYKYGVRPNILENPDFNGLTYSDPGDPIGPRTDITAPGWTKYGTVENGITPDGNVIFYKVTGFDNANYWENNETVNISVNRSIKIDINYESIPALTATDMIFGVELNTGTDIYYLQPQQNGIYAWDTDIPYFEYTQLRSDQGIGSGVIISSPVPESGIITFKIYPPDSPDGDIIFTSIKLSEQREESDAIGEIHTTEQDGDYSYASPTVDVFNGDDTSDFFLGTIFRTDQDTPTTLWVRRGLSEGSVALPLANEKKFLRIAVEEIQRMYRSPFVRFEGSIFNYFAPLSRFSINLIDGYFMPLSLNYDLQQNICKAVLGRIANDQVALVYKETPDYGETNKVLVK